MKLTFIGSALPLNGRKEALIKTLRVMKITATFLLAITLTASAAGTAQNVTLNVQNVPLKEAFAQLQKQSGYYFTCTNEVLKSAGNVSANVKNVPLNEALDVLFKGLSLSYVYKGKLVVVSSRSALAEIKSTTGILAASGGVRGRVMNENGEPLVGASVSIKGTNNQGSTTDANGYYKIETIPEGLCTLVASFVGYASKTATVTISDNSMAELNFKLPLSLVNLDEFAVTGSLSERKIRAYAATMAVIDQKDLKNRNLVNIQNVLEAIPGIVISPGYESGASQNARQPSFGMSIRGYNGLGAGATIKYLIDGVEIVADGQTTAGGSLSVLQTLDPNDIEKIEVLKGPMASTLYGNGASGGVISITTKKGKVGKTKVNLKLMLTDNRDYYTKHKGYSQDYSANISGGVESFNYLLGVGYNLYPRTKLTDLNNGRDDKTNTYTVKIGGKLKNLVTDLSLQYGTERMGSGTTAFSDNNFRKSLGLDTFPTPDMILDGRYTQRGLTTSMHLKHTINNKLYHDLTVGYNTMNFNYENHTPYMGLYTYNTEYLYSKINVRYFLNYNHEWSRTLNSNVTAGVEYNSYDTRQLVYNSTTEPADFLASSTPAVEGAATFSKSPAASTGYFAEVVTGFKNDLFLTTGIRYDVNKAYGDNVKGYAQPRVGLSYNIDAGQLKLKPRIVWGVSSLAPDPTYKTTHTQVLNFGSQTYIYTYTGNPDIKPMRSSGYEFGADIFYGNNYALNITYYDQRLKDMISATSTSDYTTNPATINIFYYNSANAINRGLELSAKAVIKPFDIDLSYTHITSKWGDKVASTDAITYPSAPQTGIPKSSAYARLTYNIPSFFNWTKKGGRISLDWKYNGESFNFDAIGYGFAQQAWQQDPSLPFPDFYQYYYWQKSYDYFNLRFDYSASDFAVFYIDVQNLLNRHGSVAGQTSFQFPGRRINFGVNLTF